MPPVLADQGLELDIRTLDRRSKGCGWLGSRCAGERGEVALLGNSFPGRITGIGIGLAEKVTDSGRGFFGLVEQDRVVSRLNPFDANIRVVPRKVLSEFPAAWNHLFFDRIGGHRAKQQHHGAIYRGKIPDNVNRTDFAADVKDGFG